MACSSGAALRLSFKLSTGVGRERRSALRTVEDAQDSNAHLAGLLLRLSRKQAHQTHNGLLWSEVRGLTFSAIIHNHVLMLRVTHSSGVVLVTGKRQLPCRKAQRAIWLIPLCTAGSGSGIGQATALAFAQNGATKFVLLDMNETGLEATASQLRGIEPTVDVKTFSLDISQEKAVVEAISSAYAHFGRLDYVVQCAGMNQRPRAPLHDTEMENFDKVFNVNTRGLYIVQREVVRRMRGQELPDHGQRGSIVNISSNSAVQPTPLLVPVGSYD